MKKASGLLLPLLDGGSDRADAPEYLRLYRRVRRAILSGTLSAGTRLPSSRTLVRDLKLSRTTIEAALSQLRAEGLLVRHVGSGTFVADVLSVSPRRPERFRKGETAVPEWSPRERRGAGSLSARGRAIAAVPDPSPETGELVFGHCGPGLDALPIEAWRKLAARHARTLSSSTLLPGDAAGYEPLRKAVATYLAASRGVRCDWRQVLILSSTQQALSLTAHLLLDPGDEVWMEDPGYNAARGAFRAAGATPVPVPVDEEGIRVEVGIAHAPGARLAYVTPSHQFPLGATMSLRRRFGLLEWAAATGGWIFEDDYDSEFRYVGRPLTALQGIDNAGRVLYAGTFNKTIFPSLRLAYLVVPEDLVEPFRQARTLIDGFPPTFPQAVLADFIEDGHFSLLLRRVRDLYAERREAFLGAVERELSGRVRPGGTDAGMHATLLFPDGTEDASISDRMRARGVDMPPLSCYYAAEPRQKGLLAYFSAAPAARIPGAVALLREVLSGATGLRAAG